MSYRTEQILRVLACAGMLGFAVSNTTGWAWGILFGVIVWAFLLPFTISPFVARFLPSNLRDLWRIARWREEPVPQLALSLAQKLNTHPPKAMKVEPGSHINAAVTGNILLITEGLRARLWTRTAEGIMAHEMGHLAGRHGVKMKIALYLTMFCTIVTVSMIDNYSWAVLVAVTLTFLTVFFPLFSRHLEYDADRRAAAVVGSGTMSHALRNMVDRPFWGIDCDTHPSIEKRLARLCKEPPRASASEGLLHRRV